MSGKKRWHVVCTSLLTLTAMTALVLSVLLKNDRHILESLGGISAKGIWMLLMLGIGYQALEAAVCRVLVGSRLSGFSFRQAVDVTFLGVFGNVSTLAAGTIPMQSYYLHRAGLHIGSGVGIMTLEYVFHKASVLLFTTVMLLWQRKWLAETMQGLARYIVSGYAICFAIIGGLVLLCTWDKIRDGACWLVAKLPEGGKWGRRKKLWKENVTLLYQEAQTLLHDRPCRRKAFVLNMLKLFELYAIPFVCLRLLEVPAPSLLRVELLTALMHLIANALPNVAGVGPTEFAFLLIFSNSVGRAAASSALVLYRVATYYLPFLISMMVFLVLQKRMFDSSDATRPGRT